MQFNLQCFILLLIFFNIFDTKYNTIQYINRCAQIYFAKNSFSIRRQNLTNDSNLVLIKLSRSAFGKGVVNMV